jgi:hypothetical protein
MSAQFDLGFIAIRRADVPCRVRRADEESDPCRGKFQERFSVEALAPRWPGVRDAELFANFLPRGGATAAPKKNQVIVDRPVE